MTEIDRLKEKLINLRLKEMANNIENLVAQAAQHNRGPIDILDQLAEIELEYRRQKAIKSKWNQSKLTEKITIDQFDFNHHSSRKEQKTHIINLLSTDFIRSRVDVILIGNPGVGKTFLAKCL
ncbi:MAG: ATP-binding protein, partial [Deltaproteobacteria bacterium]|nr:ATP-binding protein [Deltaproteobacteria bacterium]